MSHLTQAMASPTILRDWCRETCATYPNVDIKNMSTSFRDGLAFCAIIHKHRPDLIDFSSLSKDNVFQNNKLAFEVAETKLGIPALLDPKEMASTKVPDCLSVITYLSQYYCVFNRKSHAGPAGLRSSNVTVLNNLAKLSSPDSLKALKSVTHLESDNSLSSNTRPRTVCNLCFKPVHLIQRHLVDGKICHRSCFRCKVCHSTLLPDSYTHGSDAGSLICTHHVTDNKSAPVKPHQQTGSSEKQPRCEFQAGYLSLGGLPITSVPCYTNTTDVLDRQVCQTPEMEGTDQQERSRENSDLAVGQKSMAKKSGLPSPPLPSVKDRTDEVAGKAGPADGKKEATEAQQPSEHSSPPVQSAEGSAQPLPAPRRTADPSVFPVPAPRIKTSQTSDGSSSQSKSPVHSSHITSPTSGSPKVKTNHPWMTIVHPGPWTQLPPAPAPVPTPRSKSVSNLQGHWYRPKVLPPNPFEDVDEDIQEEAVKPESKDQTKSSVEAGHSENGSCDTVETSSEPAEDTSQLGSSVLDENRNPGDSLPDVTETAARAPQGPFLPRSLSVPIIIPDHSQSSSVPVDQTEADESSTSCKSKPACKENPFDRKPGMPKSKTFQDTPSRRAPAPGHGFPLIKRKVQTDQCVSTEDLQTEMGELNKHVEALEQRGVELERNLRDCKNAKDEERLLMEWFSLIHERHVLVRRDTELVLLTKQKKLEDRQADVEYELRCLLNKPETDWSEEDRGREQELMDELVSIIEQRNQIVSSLDQDRQREREEDELWEASLKSKEFKKDGLKELKKSKGKFKPIKLFKMLSKDSMDKKS